VAVGRVATVLITLIAATASFYMTDVGRMFRFIVLFGNGTGAVLLLRWFWWRVNAWAEWTALVTGTTIAILLSAVPSLAAMSFGAKLALTAFGTMVTWIPVMLLTKPEPDAVLDAFYRKARPGGPGWAPVRQRTGLVPASNLGADLTETVSVVAQIIGAMLAIGGLVVGSAAWAVGGTIAAVIGSLGARSLRAQRIRRAA
jgi:hypothetical protein